MKLILISKIIFSFCVLLMITSCNHEINYKSDTLEIIKISDQVYQHISFLDVPNYGKFPCNGLIFYDEGEAVIFDTPTTELVSKELIDWVEEILQSKIKAVIPTHFHNDCLQGLQVFHDKEIESYASNKTITLAQENGKTIPINGFDEVLKLQIGSKSVISQFFGEGHTKDNIVGYIPSEDILFGGCLIKSLKSGKGNLEDANTKDWSNTVNSIKAKYPNVKTIVPGHGDIGGIALLDYTIDMFTEESEIDTNWCDQPLRSQFSELKAIEVSSDWFKVYEVGDEVYAIAEPYNFQEIISYLILGKDKALLFDSGMGMSSIASTVNELTNLPVKVLNSHTHYDHIGGNYEFDSILGMNTDYTKGRAANGISHENVMHETQPEAMCRRFLPEFDAEAYKIHPFTITEFIKDDSEIELGNRLLRVVAVPGHTPDAIALYDETNGYLWTGDTFYEAPIWLFDEGTDLKTYRASIERLDQLSDRLKTVFPGHNTPIAEPIRLKELTKAFDAVLSGEKQPKTNSNESETVLFEFEHFSFMIRKALLDID